MNKNIKISMTITYFLSYGGIIGMLFLTEYRVYYTVLTVLGMLLIINKNIKNKTYGIMASDFCVGFLAILMGYFIPNQIGIVKQLIVACLLAIYTTWIIDQQKKSIPK